MCDEVSLGVDQMCSQEACSKMSYFFLKTKKSNMGCWPHRSLQVEPARSRSPLRFPASSPIGLRRAVLLVSKLVVRLGIGTHAYMLRSENIAWA